jgi:hypothetical protein
MLGDLEAAGKLKEAELDAGAQRALKTLPFGVAIECLKKIRDEKNSIRNVNAYVVKNASHLRNMFGLDDAVSSSSEESDSDSDEE